MGPRQCISTLGKNDASITSLVKNHAGPSGRHKAGAFAEIRKLGMTRRKSCLGHGNEQSGDLFHPRLFGVEVEINLNCRPLSICLLLVCDQGDAQRTAIPPTSQLAVFGAWG